MSDTTQKSKKSVGMREKLIGLFVVIKVIPLVLLALIAWYQSVGLSVDSNKALEETKEITIRNTKKALENIARENIERLTTDAAAHVAAFLYGRDANILAASLITPSVQNYESFVNGKAKRVMEQSEWIIDPNDVAPTAGWKSTQDQTKGEIKTSSNPQNDQSFSYRPADLFTYKDIPLFREITFLDLNGKEQIKVTTCDCMDTSLKDISKKENTFVKAEDYFQYLPDLKKGEIYVSDVIGAYVPSKIIGIYNKFNANRVGIEFDPESSAFAGWENPVGKRFNGIVRWATPVYENGEKIGYVTLALNHDHLIELMEHITPMSDRYTELSDAFQGNYAFIWDYKGRSVVHPRHHSIVGYDPETGDPAVPWLEETIYESWMASGKSYVDFIVDEPTFTDQRRDKKPAKALTASGNVGLDCRYLNNAPQCDGWFDLAEDGGSGSFVILWSGLTKLTTAAAIPYYTGHYADSKIGFGFVAIGAGLDDFLSPATETGKVIEGIIAQSNKKMNDNLTKTAYSLTISTVLMTVLVIFIAIWLASNLTKRITFINAGILRFRNGERQFRFEEPIHDEIGTLYDSFNIMADNVVNSVLDLLVITDVDGKIIYLNDKALTAFEMTFEDAIGKKYENISGLAENNPLTCYFNDRPQNVHLHPVTQLYYKGDVEKFYNEENVHIGYMVTVQDVTSVILQQQEVALQRRLLLTVFASSPDVIWYKNADNKYLAVNPRFCSVSGKAIPEILEQTAQDILPNDLVFGDMENDTKAKRDKLPIYSEEEYIFSDGHHEVLEIVRTPVYNDKNEYDGIVGVARDMSERVNIEKRLRETQTSLEKAVIDSNKANASKSAFLARMSHEIRTPMNAILGMSTIAKDKLIIPETTVEDVTTEISQIEVSAKHLLSLVNEILETSKIDATTITLKKEIFNMSALISDVGTIVKDFCEKNGVRLRIDIPTIDNQFFLSDPMRIRQVLITLISNAIGQAGSSNGTVTLSLVQEQVSGSETRFSFTVQDTGDIMSKEKVDALENPLEISQALINSQVLDEAFSLSLCQHIVRHLGGKIKINKENDDNTLMFAFALEQVQAHKEEKDEKPTDLSMLTGKKALLVDDVEINRIILKALLSTVKTDIEEANDGDVAVEMFKNSPVGYYDVVLMDIQMPKMNGFEATENIRKLDRPDAKTVPILAVTANTFQEDIKKSLESGMNAHFSKPVNRDNLFKTMVNIFATLDDK